MKLTVGSVPSFLRGALRSRLSCDHQLAPPACTLGHLGPQDGKRGERVRSEALKFDSLSECTMVGHGFREISMN